MNIKDANLVCQFKITLQDIEPPVWRRIQVPLKYNFWDLHVAIQDAMGWLDCHLHAFYFKKPGKKHKVEIGIPGEEFDGEVILPGWEIMISEHFPVLGSEALYVYDFGDDWRHNIILEGYLIKEKRGKYPICIGGERACPPEDCGGVPGYYNLQKILADPSHEEHKEMQTWLKGYGRRYYPFDSDTFDPSKVRFDNPKKRWKIAFSSWSAF